MRQGWSEGWFTGTVLHVTDVYVRVLMLAACAHRKRGVPQGFVLGLAQTPERGGGYPSLEKQFPDSCKQPKAIQPQGNLGYSPVKTIKMSDVLKTIQEVAKFSLRIRAELSKGVSDISLKVQKYIAKRTLGHE